MPRRLRACCLSLLAFVLGGSLGWPQNEESDSPVYLFSTFKEPEQDGLRYAYSFDGYHWTNVPGLFLKPTVGGEIMRDPSIVRGPDGVFHLVWTTAWKGHQGFGYASSTDLVHWSEDQFIPVMEHEPTTVNVWAPELFYDDVEDQFIICWASTIPGRFPDHLEARDNNHRMYYTTTRDFRTFTPTEIFLEPGFSVIDCRILKEKDRYVLLLKDNTRPERNISVAFGDTPLGPWGGFSEPFTGKLTEGPTALKLGRDWLIYYDSYGDKTYRAVQTRDFKSFEEVTDQMTFPVGLKHGTVFEVTRKDLDYLLRVGREQAWQGRLPWVSPLTDEEVQKRLSEIDAVSNQGPFRPHWESITNLFEIPQWYQDAKFGLFIHWGPYAVPAFGSEWYPRNMYRPGSEEYEHHRATYGLQAEFGYKDFIPQFHADKFVASDWARLFKEAGVRYVVPVAEHHDGFPIYDSDLTGWCAGKMGPERDLLGEQAEAYREEGIVFGASSHRAEHWFFFEHGLRYDSDVADTNNASLYGPAGNKRTAEARVQPPDEDFIVDWLLRSCEIVDQYRPEVMYFDWWIWQPAFQPYLKKFAAYYYNRAKEWGKPVAINFKEWEGKSFPRGSGVFDVERGQFAEIGDELWQTCTSVSKSSWGYVSDHDYKQAGEIVDDLVDIVSKNGTMLLNIGPRADGTIPGEEIAMLKEIGAWLSVNGEAIYGTRPWVRFGEGPTEVTAGSFSDTKRDAFTSEDIRFTTRDGMLYAIVLDWPSNGRVLVRTLGTKAEEWGGEIAQVELLGDPGALNWRQTRKGLRVSLPETPPCDHAVALKITRRQG